MIKPKKAIEEIIPYEIDYYKQDWRLKLDANENIYGCSNVVLSAIKNLTAQDVSLYPAYGNLIDKFSSKYELDKNQILFTNGCDEALNVVVNAYLDVDDEILAYQPTFSMPFLYAKCAGAKTRYIEYSEKYVFNKGDFRQNIQSQTKIVYIATPNNPTGELAKASVVELLLQEFPEVLFILDCTYINFSYKATFLDYIDLTRKYDNIIAVKSYSKDFAIAGLRFGLTIANENIISNLKKVVSPYSVNAVALNCVLMILNDEAKMEENRDLNIEAREFLIQELKRHGFHPYESEANFVLCDFHSYCDFYYEKLKKNGVIVRKYSKNSSLSSCLRITVPKMGGVKFISELLNKKDVLIFDIDGVIFDVRNSSISAIAQTYEYFSHKKLSKDEINEVKSLSGMNCDWDVVSHLLQKNNIEVQMGDIITVFQNIFYNSKDKTRKYLIDNEQLLISKNTFERLNEKYDMVIFSERFREEIKYSFEKFDIDKYFYYYITSDELPKNMLKPHAKGVLNILEHCPHKTIKYLGDSIDDVLSGNSANVEMIGVISPGSDYNLMVNNFRHLGVKNILGEIKNIENFLEEIEQEYAKNS